MALGAALVLTGFSAAAQAFCSLRDPNRYVRSFFPESTSYKSVVRKVSRETALRLKKERNIRFDPREFGNHTLYVVYQGSRVIGFLQAHSEVVDWGVAEVVWALDRDGNLKRFGFQRCRSPQRSKVEAETVQKILRGLGEEQLRARLKNDGVDGILKQAGLTARSKKLLEGIVNGALKMQVLMGEFGPKR